MKPFRIRRNNRHAVGQPWRLDHIIPSRSLRNVYTARYLGSYPTLADAMNAARRISGLAESGNAAYHTPT